MNLKSLKTYRVPLLISLTIFIVIIALRVERDVINIALIFLGSLAGAFFLDLDYIIYAYFLDPAHDFSTTLKGYIKHKDFSGALDYVKHHGKDLKEKTLNSAIFQIALGAAMLYIASSNTNLLIKSLVIATFANSIYRMFEEYFEGDIQQWFWAIKMGVNTGTFIVYATAIALTLIYSINLL